MRKILLFISILLVFGLFVALPAQNLGFKGIAVKGGIVSPESPWDMGFFGGVSANMGEISPGLSLFPFVSYWSSGYSNYGIDLGLSNFQLGADIHYPLTNVQGVYVGGGISFNILSVDYPMWDYTRGWTTASDSENKIGFGGLVGYEIQLGGRQGFVEGKYNIISDFNTLEVAIGIFF